MHNLLRNVFLRITDVEGCFGVGTHLHNLVDSKPTLVDHDRSSQRLPCPSLKARYAALFSASPQPQFCRGYEKERQ
uniref:Uncharacterized protein n=1 Tax=Physcomitrium patens TaxID=3218 RepID=A0A2K1KVW6_PHYPA|nr:hypothetical protein PHYPA_004929 [Physcomitrium patens]